MRERRKPEVFQDFKTAFDPNKFNFTKVKPEEILFGIENISKKDSNLNGKHVIMINVSPLEHNHILLVPNINKCLSQKLDAVATQMAIELILLSSHPGWRVGFNGPCALASVNHQHVHAWALNRRIYLEHAKVVKMNDKLYRLDDPCIRGLAFQLHGSTVKDLSRTVFAVADHLHANNVAHNVFVTRGLSFAEARTNTVRVFIFPRKSFNDCKVDAVKIQPFNVACAELSGHIPVYESGAYEMLTEREIEEFIGKEMIPDDDYDNLVRTLAKVIN